ncbi:BQ2448_4074 [Microbotryum intermedium]|uniref:BQ2448_4074 protein n=1 Tax=Microbotryum intermedium TaxID=269621 RepID=A0A238FH34_9BASI|nr:BQ2448_4074 [Microbotryum intermedium]
MLTFTTRIGSSLARGTATSYRITLATGSLASRPARASRHAFSTAPNPDAEAILDKKDDGITHLTLNRPKAKNALSMQLLADMRSAIDEIRFDGKTRTLILNSSSSGIFCAGADLKQRKSMTQTQIARFLHDLRSMLSELSSLPCPVIAALDGAALGGGLELALAADLRVASHQATKIGLPETRLAIIPGAGGTQRLSRLIGVSKAKDLIFTSRALNAQQALEVGIVNYLANEGQTATEKAEEVAKEFLKAAAKLAIDVGSGLNLEAGLDFEATAYKTILTSQDRVEGLKAFAEKRAPVYKGE